MAAAESNARPVRFERRMSDAEALMWNVEKDPSLRSTFLNVTFLDASPSFDGFRRRIERAVAEIPRLRQHVAPAPARLAPPEWVDDASFDLDFHVRHVSLPPPGTDRQLLDLAALHLQDPFDRARPLWQFTIVDGLEGGRAALLAKMHHTITDGVGGVRLSAMFIDLERDAADPSPPAPAPAPATSDAPEGLFEALARSLAHDLRRQLGMGRRLAATVADQLQRPQRAPRLAAATLDALSSVARELVFVDAARSPLWAGRRSLGRHFEVLTVDLDRLKARANDLGGTVNDAFVSCIAGAAGAYHREQGVEVDLLRVAMPVNTRERDDKSAGGNAFSPTRALVPAGTKDPVERFHAIRDRLGTTRRERAVTLTDSLAGVLNALPTSTVVRFARQQAETVDFAASNVRGAPWDLFIAGAEILHNHPMGPTAGTAFNATVLSYRGQLDIGLNIDTAAIDEPGLLRDCVEEAFREFVVYK